LALAVGFFLWHGARRTNGDDDYAYPARRGPEGGSGAEDDTRTIDVFGDESNDDTRTRSDIHGR
jgi:hypothetical protein